MSQVNLLSHNLPILSSARKSLYSSKTCNTVGLLHVIIAHLYISLFIAASEAIWSYVELN